MRAYEEESEDDYVVDDDDDDDGVTSVPLHDDGHHIAMFRVRCQ